METYAERVIQLRDRDGVPYTLDPCLHIVCVTAKDRFAATNFYFNKQATIVDPKGYIQFTALPEELPDPGLFLGEVTVYENLASSSSVPSDSSSSSSCPNDGIAGKALQRFHIYMEVEPNLDFTDLTKTGVSIAEVRLSIRDKCPEDNFLLDNVEFSDTEIAWAIRQPIDWWNETPPSLPPLYTTATFPYSYYWTDAIIGELMGIAALNYERNRLQYSAANLSVDDKDKARFYLEAEARYKASWRDWAYKKKKEINMNNSYGTVVLNSYGNKVVGVNTGGSTLRGG